MPSSVPQDAGHMYNRVGFLTAVSREMLCAEPVETQVSTGVFCVGLSPTSRRIVGPVPYNSCVKIEFVSQGSMHGLLCCSRYS